ncbi:hypothetical protein ACGFWI_38270 [Streptomyces sp. NPDC048434]|uniref:hypothetical protein n=1 Tax=Streptomyces sp. NPDC048434 TaxID=3365549 RepID=UPI00371908D9
MPTHGVTTIYDRIGDAFAWLCLTGVVVLTITALARPWRPTPATTSTAPDPSAA